MNLRKWLLLLMLIGTSQAQREKRFRHKYLKGNIHRDAKEGRGDLEEQRDWSSPKGRKQRDLKGKSGDDDVLYFDDDVIERGSAAVTLKVSNLSYNQPLSAMFVMVHNTNAVPLFSLGSAPSVALQILAENGDPGPLAEAYGSAEGVFFSGIYTEGAPWMGGNDIFITLPYESFFPYVTIASKALNTNDGFVALNAVRIIPNLALTGPMYDAGSEINNEQCSSIPGPACPKNSENIRSGNGEGFVMVHRGFHGLTKELPATEYDWRNPLIRIEMINPLVG